MKDYILDTNIVGYIVDYKNGSSKKESVAVGKKLSLIEKTNTKLLLCPISVGESEYGIRLNSTGTSSKSIILKNIVDSFGFLDINKNIARESYSELRKRLYIKYAPKKKKSSWPEEWVDPISSKEIQIQENDLWLAAIAMTYNMILVTNDKMTAIKDVAGTDVTFENWVEEN